MSKLQRTIQLVTQNIETFKLSSALGNIIEFNNALSRYVEKGGSIKVVRESIKTITLLSNPFIPHISQEIWEGLGEKGFIEEHAWPVANEKLIDVAREAAMDMRETLAQDIRVVMDLAKVSSPKEIKLIVSAKWKFDLLTFLKEKLNETRNPGEIFKSVMAQEEFRPYGQDISKLVPSLVKDPSKMPETMLSHGEELTQTLEAVEILSELFGCEIVVEEAENSKEGKAKSALPGKPGISIR
jgi:leucyl-tRNA synthetase